MSPRKPNNSGAAKGSRPSTVNSRQLNQEARRSNKAPNASALADCGKPPISQAEKDSSSTSLPQAARLNPPASVEGASPAATTSERKSLSAKQAADLHRATDSRADGSPMSQSRFGDSMRLSTGDMTVSKPPLETLGVALQLLPYQRRWVEDDSALKVVVKARQIGYSFAASIRALLECLKRKTTWIFLSKGERQSRLLMEKVQEHVQSCGILARACESSFFEGTLVKQLEVRFANGSVIYGLPANPDTARGYSGNVTLDEFAFHADADKIYAALFPTITRGYCIEVISTPNGQQGKFYEIAKAAGLVEGQESGQGSPLVTRHSSLPWSGHRCDIYEAVRQGLKIDLQLLRAGCDDESSWQQEFCCQFISTAENFIPPALVTQCVSAEASKDCPPQFLASAPLPDAGVNRHGISAAESEYYLGIDIGRHHDRTVFWLDEVRVLGSRSQVADEVSLAPGTRRLTPEIMRVAVARLVRTLSDTPFAEQVACARELLSVPGHDGRPLVRRACIDSTGMGAPLAESLEHEFGPRVEPVVFTAAAKEDMAYRVRRRMEQRLDLIPDAPDIARAFGAVKKLVTASGNTRFDAERTDHGHADQFWAKALADLAAEQPPSHLSDGVIVGTPRAAVWMPVALPAVF